VLVAGSVCQDNGFVAALEEAGCMVADDDLCMGSRSFLLPDVPDGDPIEALAEVYLARPPCPAFHKPGFDPAKHLVDRVHEAHADGVVFLLTKFCDPWAFDYPHIRETLAAQDIPALLLEVEQNLPAPEQYRTRAEAFAEMLQARAAR
jgi:benzoyl-CoA reductase/2-hydroxyglutaryl-CoA dehydratase subunit BcrC/BadD/HgdB